MLDGLPWGDILSKGGPSAVLTAGVWMILTGRLVPRFFYQQKVDESKEWMSAAKESAKQTAELLEYARTADRILKSLPRGGVHSEVD